MAVSQQHYSHHIASKTQAELPRFFSTKARNISHPTTICCRIAVAMVRKNHKKSRLGCLVCKKRKVKCDETKPTCRRCKSSGRPCSYTALLPSLPTPASTPALGDERCSAAIPGSALGALDRVSTLSGDGQQDVSLDPELVDARFSLVHLDLLEHLRTEMTGTFRETQPDIHHFFQLGYTEGLRVPYVMDQLLALAAAHKSTVVGDGNELQQFYRTEATRLQTRALNLIDLRRDAVNDDNSLALFIFSTLIGQHVMFDIFNSGDTFPVILDKFVQCLDLHQGIRTIAGESMSRLEQVSLHKDMMKQSYLKTNPQSSTQGTECAGLLTRIRHCELAQNTIDVYCETVNIIQYLLDSLRSSPRDRKMLVVQEWLVRVPPSYPISLRQRRPEALAIFAHYAVLLHYARDYWVVGTSGRFLIQSIATNLGDYWEDWLSWPLEAVRDVEDK